LSLPRLDFSTFSHNASKWPLPGKLLLGCALAGLVLVVGDCVYLSPSRERLHEREAQEEVLQQVLAQKVDLASRLEGGAHPAQVMQEKTGGALGHLSGTPDMPALLDEIARLVAANGVVVEGVTVLDEQTRPFYIEEPVHVDVVGAYHDLATFVSALGGLSRIVTVHDITLRSEGSLLRLGMLVKTYRSTSLRGEPDSVFESGPAFVYDAFSLRDPFQPVALQVDHLPGRPVLAPDLARVRGALEKVAIDQFEMVGTLSRGEQNFALLRVASTVHRLAVGDYLGPNHGKVTAIHDGYIELAELFPDKQGAWLERPRTLVLKLNS